MSRSLELARGLLGQVVTVTIDWPMGSRHPKHGFVYPVNYGYVAAVIAPDGDELDAYFAGRGSACRRRRSWGHSGVATGCINPPIPEVCENISIAPM
jgi:hypothetical protein